MQQKDYDAIATCIQYGAPALAPELLLSFNSTIENSNKYIQEQKALAAELAKAELAKAELTKIEEAKKFAVKAKSEELENSKATK